MQIGPIGIHDVSIKKEFWNEFAKMNSGDLKIIKTKSNEFEKLQLVFNYKGANINLVETDTKPLRVHIEIQNYKNKAEFILTKTDFIDKLLSPFSRNKVETNSIEFNQTYLLKSKNEDLAKTIFDEPKIQNLILDEKIMMISGFVEQSLFKLEMVVNRDVNHLEKLNKIGLLTKMIIEKTDANKS
jgi:hypothetical protein